MTDADPQTALQEALFHDPGEFSALVVLRRGGADAAAFIDASKRLLSLTRLRELPNSGYPKNLYLVVGLGIHLAVEGGVEGVAEEAARSVFPEGGPFVQDAGDVIVQIAAATAGDRALALRMVREVFAPLGGSADAILGQRLLNGQENFGFRDGGLLSRAEVLERIGSNFAGTWLLHQQFAQDVGAFLRLSPDERVKVVGRVPSNLFGRAPNDREFQARAALQAQAQVSTKDGHYQRMVQLRLPMVRRGFPYQSYSEDGLVFLAASARVEVFADALLQMAAGSIGVPDKLLAYVKSTGGGLYYCPAVDWIADLKVELPPTTMPLRHDVPLVSYTTSQAFINWMLNLRALGAFEAVTASKPAQQQQAQQSSASSTLGLRARLRRGDLQPHMDKLYETLSDADTREKLKRLQAEAEDAAGEINEAIDDYITFN